MINENELPKNWEIKKLGEVCKITTGKWDANHAVENGKYRFYTCAYDYLFCDTSRFSGECIILPGNGANVGELFYYKGEFDAYQRTYVIQNIKIFPKYLFYHMKLLWKRGTDSKQYDSATNYIRIGNFLEYDLHFPPFAEQERIVAKIEELFSELDAGLESLKTAQTQLKTYRQAVLEYAFEGKFTNDNLNKGVLPDGWKWKRLGDVAKKITDGEHATPRRTSEGVLLLSARNIQNGFLSLQNVDYIPEDEYQRIIKRCHPEENDILISCSGSVGRVCRVPANLKFTMVRSVALVKLNLEQFNPKFVEYLLLSPILQKQIEKGKKATAQANLFIGPIKELQIIYCSLEEQQRIVEEIESRLSVCDKLEETINASLKQAEALRQSILKQAFKGKLVKPKEVEKPKRTAFYQMQTLGLIVDRSKQRNIQHGEMTLAKYAFLAEKIYGVPIYENYQRLHLGPYPTEIKKNINNKEYFKIENNTIRVLNEEKLFKYHNDYKEQIESAVDELAEIFSSFEPKDRPHKTELLATVCKVIEDIQTTEIEDVRRSMAEWKIDLKDKRFNNKAEKFGDEETAKCVEFIIKKGWVSKLVR